MRFLKIIGWVLLLIVAGVVGSLGIGYGVSSFIDDAIRLPSGPIVYTGGWDTGYVTAEGTITIDNDRQAFPLQVTKVRCYRDEKVCSGATAEIGYGKMLYLSVFRHDILLWNNTTLIFREDANCVQYVYTIDRTSQRVVGTRTKKPNVSGCESIQERPLSLSLVNGFDVWWKLHQEQASRVLPFMWIALGAWWIALICVGWRFRPSKREAY